MNVREKMESFGVDTLTCDELVSLLGKNEKVSSLNEYDAFIYNLSPAKRAVALAALELKKRVQSVSLPAVHTVEDAVKILFPLVWDSKKERFCVMCLDTKNHVTHIEIITTGTLDTCCVSPREVFNVAVRYNAARVIVAHNHPSGDPSPSLEDRKVTKTLKEAGEIMGIAVLDSLIIGNNGFYSMEWED